MSSLSARRLTLTVVLIVVGAVMAVVWLVPSAGASTGTAQRAAAGLGVKARSSTKRRPSPVRIRERKSKAPKGMPRGGRGSKPRRIGWSGG